MPWRIRTTQGNEDAEFAKIMREIEVGETIRPKHAQSPTLDNRWPNLIHPYHREAYPKTADFGVRFNRYLGYGNFRVQEVAETLLRGSTFGRSYDLFYNRLKVGKIELSPAGDREQTLVGMNLSIRLSRPHYFAFDDVERLLQGIADAIRDRSQEPNAMAIQSDINRAMVKCLWPAMLGPQEEVKELWWGKSGPAQWILDDEYKQAPASSDDDEDPS